MARNPEDFAQAAIEVMQRAHSPYSRFKVGAALLGADGSVYTGCNVENASFGLTICAERTAVFKAVSEGCTGFEGLFLVCDGVRPVPPCGACLQVLKEFADDMPIILADLHGNRVSTSLKSLLPGAFTPSDLVSPSSSGSGA